VNWNKLVVVSTFPASVIDCGVEDRKTLNGPWPPGQLKAVSAAPAPLSILSATPSLTQSELHALGRGSGPPVFVKQTSFAHEFPVYEKTDWLVVQTHFAPTPPGVPAGTLEVNPPGPADGQTKPNASPPDLLVTLFSTWTGNVWRTLRSHWLSAPFAGLASRSRVFVAARTPVTERSAIEHIPAIIENRNFERSAMTDPTQSNHRVVAMWFRTSSIFKYK